MCKEKRRLVKAVDKVRESPLSELAVKAAGPYPLPYEKEAVFRNGNLGGNTESFVPFFVAKALFYVIKLFIILKGKVEKND